MITAINAFTGRVIRYENGRSFTTVISDDSKERRNYYARVLARHAACVKMLGKDHYNDDCRGFSSIAYINTRKVYYLHCDCLEVVKNDDCGNV